MSPIKDWGVQFPHAGVWGEADGIASPEEIPGFRESGSLTLYTPYLDLGYTPKEIGRLRMETKAYSLMSGNTVDATSYGPQFDSYSYFLGYYGALDSSIWQKYAGLSTDAFNQMLTESANTYSTSKFSPNSYGWMAFKGHTPRAAAYVWTNPMPQDIDGHAQYNSITKGMNVNYDQECVKEMVGGWRRGKTSIFGDNLESITINNDYGV
jgi:hypothetical protein